MEKPFFARKRVLIPILILGFLLVFLGVTAATVTAMNSARKAMTPMSTSTQVRRKKGLSMICPFKGPAGGP